MTKKEAETINEQTRLVDELIIQAERDAERADTLDERLERCEKLRIDEAKQHAREQTKMEQEARRRRILWAVVAGTAGAGAGILTYHIVTN